MWSELLKVSHEYCRWRGDRQVLPRVPRRPSPEASQSCAGWLDTGEGRALLRATYGRNWLRLAFVPAARVRAAVGRNGGLPALARTGQLGATRVDGAAWL